MRALAFVVALACFVGFLAPPAIAQEAESLKKEIEQLRKQLESVTERLRRLEAQPAPVTPPPAPSPTGPPAMAPPPPGVSLAELEIGRASCRERAYVCVDAEAAKQ